MIFATKLNAKINTVQARGTSLHNEERMLNTLNNIKGQGVTVQYALTFAVVFAVITGMSVYFKRIVQSRFAGARDYATHQINGIFHSSDNYNLTGKFIGQYEPYYTITSVERTTDGTIIDRIEGVGGSKEAHSREYQDMETTIKVKSNQLAPRDAY